MHWYNPKTMCEEDVPAPFTDEEALQMLCGTSTQQPSWRSTRGSGTTGWAWGKP